MFCLYLEDNWEKALKSFLEEKDHSVIIHSSNPKAVYQKIKCQFKYLKAAGGIIYNDRGDILAMKRLGKWDFPKGKLDEGECWREAAIREVEEEVGIKPKPNIKKVANTFHIFEGRKGMVLKKTKWYTMHVSGSPKGTPQEEEGITEIRWKHPIHIRSNEFDTYDSIREMIFDGGI